MMRHNVLITAMAITTVLTMRSRVVEAQPHESSQVRRISLRDAIQLGVEHNLKLLIERAERTRQSLLPDATLREYLPTLSLSGEFLDDSGLGTVPTARDRRFQTRGGVEWRSPIGTRLGAELSLNQRLHDEPSSSMTIPSLSSEHNAALSLSLSQALLKDGWRSGAATPLREAKIDVAIQRELYREQLNSLLLDVESAYWQLALAQADLEIKTRSRERAQKQFDDTKENIRRGILADVEIYVVEENLLFFEQELLQANENLVLSRRNLAQLLQLDPHVSLESVEPLDLPAQNQFEVESTVLQALEQNPSVLAQRLRLDRAQVRVAYEKNQALPSLDLETSLTLNGLNRRYSKTWSELFRADRPDWRLGLTMSIPLWFSANAAHVERATLSATQKVLELKEVETNTRFETHDLLTQYALQQKQLSLVEKRVRLGQLKLDAEVDKYKNGISTLADVVRFQRELDQALISLRRVQTALRIYRSRLFRVQGTLHREWNVGLDDERATRERR